MSKNQNTESKDMVNALPKKLRSVFVLLSSRYICLCTFHRRLREGNLNNSIILQEYLQLTLLKITVHRDIMGTKED